VLSFNTSRNRRWFCRFDRQWRITPTSRFARKGPLLLFCIFLSGCRSGQSAQMPSIEFIRIPASAAGGPDKLDVIQGRVIGGSADLRIVLYAKSGKWWVQPLVREPFTKVQPDSTWINSTHLGTEYAALLVDAGFRPPATLNEVPVRGGNVAAVAVAQGSDPGSAVSKTLQFSGYEWRIRNAPSGRGGKNYFDASNAWTDPGGALHLRIAKLSGEWTCAEVTLTRSLGYGTYSLRVHDTSRLEPAAVFSMFTYDYSEGEPNNREMDIEVTRWGDPGSKNAQYVIQPFYLAENTFRFALPTGVVTHSFHWEPGRVTFRTLRGPDAGSKLPSVAEHQFTSGVPSHGLESVRMDLYISHGAKTPVQVGDEVVIEKFEYLP
jgi:hypothetical protein